jgi:hypothetical protein
MKKFYVVFLLFVEFAASAQINSVAPALVAANSLSAEAFEGSVYAGVAQINITPPVGYSHYRGVSTGVHDSLYAKAIVFGKGHQRFALVVCDLLYMDINVTKKARSLASENTGIPYLNIMIAATHNHTGPSYNSYIDELNRNLRPTSYIAPKTDNGEDYPDWLAQRIAQSVIDANNGSMLVTIETGTKSVGGLAFNRRSVLKDGTVRMNAGVGNPDILSPAGPVDSTLGMLLVRRASNNKPIACVSNFGLHADTFGGTEFSADYPGVLANVLQEEFGKDFISIFGNGPCGDINHVNVKRGSKRPSSQEIGDKLAFAIKEEIPKLKKIKSSLFVARSEFVYVPLQQYSKKELEWALSRNQKDSFYHENPYSFYHESSFLTIRRAVKIWHLYDMQRRGEAIPPTIGTDPWTLPLEVQVFRIGDDAVIVGLPGEVFTELSMAIKKASPFKTTLVVECTNRLLPYVPTEQAYKEGGYEQINSRLVPGGGEMMIHTAVKLLNNISTIQEK